MKSANLRRGLCGLGAFLCALLGLLWLVLRPFGSALDCYPISYLINALLEVVIYFLPALLIMYATSKRWQGFRRSLRPVDGLSAGYILLLGLTAVCALGYVSMQWMTLLKRTFPERLPAIPGQDAPQTPLQWGVMLWAVALIPAFAEEMLFRSLLQERLCADFPRMGMWLAAMLFAAAHRSLEAMPAMLMLGLLFGLVYRWFGYFGSVLMHGMYNTAVLVLNATGTETSFTLFAVSLPMLLFSLAVLTKGGRPHAADGSGK